MGVALGQAAGVLHEAPDQLEATLLARLPHHLGLSGAAEGMALLEGLLLQAELQLQRGQYEHHHLHAAARTAPDADADADANADADADADADAAPPPPTLQLRPRWPCLPAAPPLLLALLQPAASVTAAAATPDGGWVACGCKDGSVVLYDLAAGQEVRLPDASHPLPRPLLPRPALPRPALPPNTALPVTAPSLTAPPRPVPPRPAPRLTVPPRAALIRPSLPCAVPHCPPPTALPRTSLASRTSAPPRIGPSRGLQCRLRHASYASLVRCASHLAPPALRRRAARRPRAIPRCAPPSSRRTAPCW